MPDTIYTVVNDNILQPKYLVNFGEYSIPTVERLNKDVYGLIDYVNKPENKKSYIISKDGKPGPVCTKLYNKLRAIQYGDEPDTHNWVTVLD